MAAWNGPRHRSWASDTMIFAVVFVTVLLATVITDWLNGPEPPPVYLTGLLGAASAALFGAAGSDKSKRDREIVADAQVTGETANRAEAKADKLTKLAKSEHPEHQEFNEPPLAESGGDTP